MHIISPKKKYFFEPIVPPECSSSIENQTEVLWHQGTEMKFPKTSVNQDIDLNITE